MKIWRIETFDGVGPYHADLELRVHLEDLAAPSFMFDDPDLHPHPIFDGFNPDGLDTWEYRVPQEYHFGFITEESLRSWFFSEETDAERLEALGLWVVVYEVDEAHVWEGNRQAMFRLYLAERVDTINPTMYAGNEN